MLTAVKNPAPRVDNGIESSPIVKTVVTHDDVWREIGTYYDYAPRAYFALQTFMDINASCKSKKYAYETLKTISHNSDCLDLFQRNIFNKNSQKMSVQGVIVYGRGNYVVHQVIEEPDSTKTVKPIDSPHSNNAKEKQCDSSPLPAIAELATVGQFFTGREDYQIVNRSFFESARDFLWWLFDECSPSAEQKTIASNSPITEEGLNNIKSDSFKIKTFLNGWNKHQQLIITIEERRFEFLEKKNWFGWASTILYEIDTSGNCVGEKIRFAKLSLIDITTYLDSNKASSPAPSNSN